MEIIKKKFDLLCKNQYPAKDSSDIMEHLTTLCDYASKCDSIFETGVRNCVSSYAFLYGLLCNNSQNKKKLFLNDINICNIDELQNLSNDCNIEIKYEWKNNLELSLDEFFDITFIDTWHVYGQLIRELNKFSTITNKYIIIHDTTIDADYGETIRNNWNAKEQSMRTGIPIDEINKGIFPAIIDFVKSNSIWKIEKRYMNNNGLTILSKINLEQSNDKNL
jgi:hypothetical protein